jgi:hypothetical protein
VTPLEIARQFLASRTQPSREEPLDHQILFVLRDGPLSGSGLRLRLKIDSESREVFYETIVRLLDSGDVQTDPSSCTYYLPGGRG